MTNNSTLGLWFLGFAILATSSYSAKKAYDIEIQMSTEVLPAIFNVQDGVERKVINNLRSGKPDSYEEILVKSDRILLHVEYLAERFFDGNILAVELTKYADKAYEELMSNSYRNMFYSRMDELGIKHKKMTLFRYKQDGSILFGDNLPEPTGVYIRDKYFMELKSDAVFAQIINKLPSVRLLMMNDLIPYPKCAQDELPIAVFGELYTARSMTYGVKLRTEIDGWRISFDNVDPLDTNALSNRVIYQTACRSETNTEEPESNATDIVTAKDEGLG